MQAQYFIVFLIADNFHDSFGGAQYLRFCDHRNWKVTNLDIVATLFGLRFGQADTRDFRLAIGAARDVIVVDRPGVLPGICLNSEDPFRRCNVRKPRSRYYVADRVHIWLRSAHVIVNLYVAAVDLDSSVLETKPVGVSAPSNRDEEFLG